MPFGLKNVEATYQRAMLTLFHDMMHKEIEVCVDDMIAKSREGENHVQILKELFERLRMYKLRLNHTRCSFMVKSGKLLGFMMSDKRIEVDRLSKGYSIYANSQDWEGCKKVLGKVELHCSVYIPINHDLWPNLWLLRKKNLGIWNKSEEAFEKIKQYLLNPPLSIKLNCKMASSTGWVRHNIYDKESHERVCHHRSPSWPCYGRLWAVKLWLSWWKCACNRGREIGLVDYVLWCCCW